MIRAFTISAIGLFVIAGCAMPFFTVNITPSYPVGIYRNISKELEIGDLVSFCPPANIIFDEALERGYVAPGFCPGGYGLLIKKILAAKGDRVEITPDGILVNGRMLKNTRPRLQDAQGRALPQACGSYILGEKNVLLASDYHPLSFDARYFGILDVQLIKTALVPFITW